MPVRQTLPLLSNSRARATRLFALLAVALGASILGASGLGPAAGAQAPGDAPLTYEDPVTGAAVTRLTTDGADGCVNYMGNLSGEAESWSPDSTRIVFAKACDNDPDRTGIHIVDVATGTVTCVARSGGHWAYPIFSHHGEVVYFIDGSDGPRDEADAKPYEVRTIPVQGALDGSTICPDTSTVLIDVRAETNSTVRDVAVLTRNFARTPHDWRFGVQVNTDGRWRTVVFDVDGRTADRWGFDNTTNPPHDDISDGDATIWSPINPKSLFTNRATGPDDPTALRGTWNITASGIRDEPFAYDPACSGDYRPSTSVAHSDWAYHGPTKTHIFLSSDRCPWLVDDQGNITLGPWRLFGYLHLNIDPTSLDGALGDVRFVADEYFDGYNAEPFLYEATLADVGLGDEPGFTSWSALRAERKLVGHRNRMDDGSNTALKAYEPHPQFSPDGRYVLWQSSSLNQVLDYACPIGFCGAPGDGERARVSYLDLYLAETGRSPEPESPVVSGATPTVATSCLAGNGRIDINIVNSERFSWGYLVEIDGLSPREIVLGRAERGRVSITGRPDGDYAIRVVGEDVFEVLRTTVTIACDGNTPTVDPHEVRVIRSCSGPFGFVLFQFVNPTAQRRGWVIEFEGVPNRSTSAAGFAQAVRGVSGRPEGVYQVRIRTDGVITHQFPVQVGCV